MKKNNKRKTILISGFPGCGKSTAYMLLNKRFKILDSDSSSFSKDDFPKNYVEHIQEKIGEVDIIFISSHKEVRNLLKELGISYHIIYPSINRKEEFIKNYKNRGDTKNFISYLRDNFETFIEEINNENNDGDKIILSNEGEFVLNNKWFNDLLSNIKNEWILE